MNRIARFTALVAIVALSLACAPRASHAGTPAKNCYFVRNHLPCPCPRGEQARAVVHAAGVTAEALGSAFRTTTTALGRAHRNQATPARQSAPAPNR